MFNMNLLKLIFFTSILFAKSSLAIFGVFDKDFCQNNPDDLLCSTGVDKVIKSTVNSSDNDIVNDSKNIINGIGDFVSGVVNSAKKPIENVQQNFNNFSEPTETKSNQIAFNTLEEVEGVRKMTLQEIFDNGLYSKENDDKGLYDFNFYFTEISSLRTPQEVNDALAEKMKVFCAAKSKSEIANPKLNTPPMLLKVKADFGVFQKDMSAIFICIDNQFNKENKHLGKIFNEYFKQAKEKDLKVVEAQAKDYFRRVQNINSNIQKTMDEYSRRENQMYENWMKNTNDSKDFPDRSRCEVVGGVLDCKHY